MNNPSLQIDLAKITKNAETIVSLCSQAGITVTGVTKAVCGDPRIALAMLKGGIKALADARIENIIKMREAGLQAKFMLLRSPMLSEIEQVVKFCDFSLNSEPKVLKGLSQAAQKYDTVHNVILMIDVGEIREGILPISIFKVGREIKNLAGIQVVGVGTNLTCYSGVLPTKENMNLLIKTGQELEQILGCPLQIYSGGNSSNLELLEKGIHPPRINQFRIGESILLGHYLARSTPIKGTYQDAFVLAAELIELKEKPSLPYGKLGANLFDEHPAERQLRLHFRGIAAIGRQDVPPDGIIPLESGIPLKVIGATSDHTVLDFGNLIDGFGVGSQIRFKINYPALLALMTSPYIHKKYTNSRSAGGAEQ
ncbi:MAG: alanine/ornithine racemase family PLP-dependent enzyme [Peptococcaceae bacterium]